MHFGNGPCNLTLNLKQYPAICHILPDSPYLKLLIWLIRFYASKSAYPKLILTSLPTILQRLVQIREFYFSTRILIDFFIKNRKCSDRAHNSNVFPLRYFQQSCAFWQWSLQFDSEFKTISSYMSYIA